MALNSSSELRSDERECPFCAEVVKAKAILCKHCGKDLAPVAQPEKVLAQPAYADDIDMLIKTAPRMWESQDEPGSLTEAVSLGSWSKVRQLISDGADVNAPNASGHTPLDWARVRGDKEMVRLLLASGAVLKEQDMAHSTAPQTVHEPVAPKQASRQKRTGPLRIVLVALCLAGGLWFFVGGGLQQSVANDFEKQYNIARRSGNSIDACVHAGLVAAAHLQARNEVGYQTWKSKERLDCSAAGMPK